MKCVDLGNRHSPNVWNVLQKVGGARLAFLNGALPKLLPGSPENIIGSATGLAD